MANLNQPFRSLCIVITLFFLFQAVSYSIASSSPISPNQEITPQNYNPSPTTLAHYHQVFYLKNTDDPKLSSRQEHIFKKRKMNRNKNKKHRRKKKKMVKNLIKSRPDFSVMLPKGFVPPSGSSPCHNDQPNSVSFSRCHLTAAEP